MYRLRTNYEPHKIELLAQATTSPDITNNLQVFDKFTYLGFRVINNLDKDRLIGIYKIKTR